MSIKKDLIKFLLKNIDSQLYSEFSAKLINRNSSIMNKNDYKVNEEFEFIFIHLPKTGGMSINHAIDTINSNSKGRKIYRGGHNPISIFHPLEKKKYFTVIRNPIDRVYSYYRMHLRDPKQNYHYLAKKGLNYFISYCSEAQNSYCKFLSGHIEKDINHHLYTQAKNNIKKTFSLIDFEKLNKDFNSFLKKAELMKINLKNLNSSTKNELTSDEKKIIEFYNFYDLKLYNFIIENNYLE